MKPLIVFCISLFSFISTFTFGQAPDTAWTKNYHRGTLDVVNSIQQTSDDGFIMVGESSLLNDYYVEIFLLKTDQNGDSLWAKVIGNNQSFYPNSVKEDPNGGYVIAGEKQYASSPRNAFVLKTDENGDSLWTHFYGGNRNTLANDITCTSDSGYVMTGWRNMSGSGENIFIHKLDADGDSVWLKIYNRGGDETGNCINRTTDGGFIVGGETDYHTAGRTDFYLIKTDSLGDTLWTRTYGRSDDDRCYSVQQTSDGGYILFGTSDSASYTTRSLAVKTDSMGILIWQQVFDRETGADYGRSVVQTTDGGYIFGGSSINPYQSQDFCFTRTDPDGNIQWIKTIGGSGTDWAYSVLQTADGGYILAGERAYLMPRGIDFWVVKLNAFPTSVDIISHQMENYQLWQNYPNPFNPTTTISWHLVVSSPVQLSVYTMTGQKVATLVDRRLPSGYHSVEWDASNFASGVYLYRLKTESFEQIKKMILMR